MLKLKEGKTFTDQSGYTHGDFIAIIESYNENPIEKNISVLIQVYKDNDAYVNKYRPVRCKTYNIENNNYDNVTLQIKNTIKSNNKTLIDSLYVLLLNLPVWNDWELI